MIARFQQSHHRREDRRHARSSRDTAFCALERGQPVFEHVYRRVGEARVDVPRFLIREARCGLCRGLEHKARREIERLGMLAELAAFDSGAHCKRVQLVVSVMAILPK